MSLGDLWQVYALGEMSLSGLLLDRIIGKIDMGIMGALGGDKFIVPANSKSLCEEAWAAYWAGDDDKASVTFYGVKTIWEAILIAFPDSKSSGMDRTAC